MPGKPENFDITLDADRHLMTITVWGNWNTACVEQFGERLRARMRVIARMRVAEGRNAAWHLLLNLADFPPQPEEIYTRMAETLDVTHAGNFSKRAIVVDGIFPKFQTTPSPGASSETTELPIYSYFQSTDDAIHWLLREKT